MYVKDNHLRNVLAVVSDRKIAVDFSSDGTTDYFTGEIISANDYYAYHMTMPGRNFNSNSYRYGGSNGQEKDNEIFEGAYTAEFWEYDSRLGRRWNTDPVKKEWVSSYSVFSNNPNKFVDVNGDDDYFDFEGNYLGSDNQKSKNIQFIKREDAMAITGVKDKGQQFVVTDSKKIAALAAKSMALDKVVFKVGSRAKDGSYTGTPASNQVISNVINHYFKGENDKYEVVYEPNADAMATTDENKIIEIQLNKYGQVKSSLLKDLHNLQVVVGHEKFHKANHTNINYYSFDGIAKELDALYSETINVTYDATTPEYKENLKKVSFGLIEEMAAYVQSSRNLKDYKLAEQQQKRLDDYTKKFEKKFGKVQPKK